jgi:hypothetical protein
VLASAKRKPASQPTHFRRAQRFRRAKREVTCPERERARSRYPHTHTHHHCITHDSHVFLFSSSPFVTACPTPSLSISTPSRIASRTPQDRIVTLAPSEQSLGCFRA